MARTRKYRSSFPLFAKKKKQLCSVCFDDSFLVITATHVDSLRGFHGERSSRHLGLERTLDALESSQLRHCAGILEQSQRLSAKRGLLSPFTSSVSHHTQRET